VVSLNIVVITVLLFQLDAPLFVTWYQCFVTVLMCFGLSFIAKAAPSVLSFPEMTIDLKLCRAVGLLNIICLLSII